MAKKRAMEPTAGERDISRKAVRTRVSQADVPSVGLEQALRVPRAIAENYAAKPTKPLNVAAAMDSSPNSSAFRVITGAAIAFGLTSGGWNATEIKIEPLGLRIVRPLKDGDDLTAKREAVLKPRIFSEFLTKYNGAPLPRTEIARNVLIEMGVPQDRSAQVLDMILESAEAVGFIRQIKEKRYVDLEGVSSASSTPLTPDDDDQNDEDRTFAHLETGTPNPASNSHTHHLTVEQKERDRSWRRVFVTHGKNRSFIEPIKKLLSFGELEPVVATERQSVSQPVPDKVMGEMRGCGAAIIHVDAEQRLLDQEAKEHIVLNPNVLIEIGAAMALYGRRFILLVREGVQLPSNLQGLYEVRYKGDSLDGDATIRLLEAINDIKRHPVPSRYADLNTSEAAETR